VQFVVRDGLFAGSLVCAACISSTFETVLLHVTTCIRASSQGGGIPKAFFGQFEGAGIPLAYDEERRRKLQPPEEGDLLTLSLPTNHLRHGSNKLPTFEMGIFE
jgi:hypothetical protein